MGVCVGRVGTDLDGIEGKLETSLGIFSLIVAVGLHCPLFRAWTGCPALTS